MIWRLISCGRRDAGIYPFAKDYATAYAGLECGTNRAPNWDYLIVHGFFLTLAVIFLIGELVQQIRLKRIPSGWRIWGRRSWR